MHTLTLVTVNVPDTTELKLDADIFERLVGNYKSSLPKSDYDSLMLEFLKRKMNSRRNVFSREVDDAIAEKMEPYCECTEDMRYLEFVDQSEDIESEYENGTANFIRLPQGNLLPEHFVSKFCIRDGMVFQRRAGQLRHEKRTKKAKKMKAYENLPFKKVYKSLADFAEHYYGATYHEEHQAYGYYTNPNSFWDWYSIGGRWPAEFLVKETCKEYSIGERSEHEEMPPAPEGYIWVVAARKKDIEWRVAFEWERERMTKRFYMLEECFKNGKLPEGMFAMMNESGIGFFGETYYVAGETLDENLKRCGYAEDLKYHAAAGAFIDHDGAYCDRFDILGPHDDKDGWIRLLDKFVEEMDDDTVVVAVDCHV